MKRNQLPVTELASLAAIAIFATPLCAAPELQKELFSAPLGKDGKWNVYGLLSQATWHDLQTFAETLKDPTGKTDKKGHLIAVSSPAEQQYMRMLAGDRHLLIGLTNLPAYGGKRVTADRREGWVWTNGEPLTLDYWGVDGPLGFHTSRDPGRTCVMALNRGAWFDTTNGSAEEPSRTVCPAVIEWDTGLDAAPEGTTALKPLLPEKLSGPEPGSGKWNAHFLPLKMEKPFHAGSLADAWEAAMKEGAKPQEFTFQEPWFRTVDCAAEGPLGAGQDVRKMGEPQKNLVQGPFGVVARAKIRVTPEQAGEWTFSAEACSTWALRLPGLEWKRCAGRGCIDPMDASTLAHASESGWTGTRGIIDLPAGDHVVELLWGCREHEAHLSLLAARGAHEMEGSTDAWTLAGAPARPKAAWLGTDDAGWEIQSTKPLPLEARGWLAPEVSLEKGLEKLEEAKDISTESGAADVNFASRGAELLTRFPGARPFPNKAAPADDRVVTAAAAQLVIPEDGRYWLGVQGDDKVLLRIADQKILWPVQDKASKMKIAGDTFYVNNQNPEHSSRYMVEVELKKGTCEIQCVHIDDSGSAVFAIFGGPAGMVPRLIRKGGAAAVEDVAGLTLAP